MTNLIGREEALLAASDAIATNAAAGAAFLATGERGIGKSAFLAAVRKLARGSGYRIVETAGVPSESNLAFSSLQRLLWPLHERVRTLPVAQREALLTAIGMHEGPSPDGLAVSLAVVHIISDLAAERPLLIAVDDIDLLDPPTLDVLSFVARRITGGQLIVATSSQTQYTPDLTPGFKEIALKRLSGSEADALLARCAPGIDDERRQWVKAHSVGNPLAIVELSSVAKSLSEFRSHPFGVLAPMNANLERGFGHRLSELPQPTQDALLVAALDASSDLQEILAATSALRGEAVGVEVFDRAREVGLLDYDENRVTFRHPLTRSAIASRESLSRQQSAHRALGESIVMSIGRRTWHRASSIHGTDRAVADELEKYGAECVRLNKHYDAVMAWERSAQLSTPPDRVRRFLLAARRASDIGEMRLAEELLVAANPDDVSEFDRLRVSLLRDTWTDHGDDSERVLRLCAQARRSAAAGQHDLAFELIFAAALTRFGAHVNVSALSEVTRVAVSIAGGLNQSKSLALLALVDPVKYGGQIIDSLAHVKADSHAEVEELIFLALAARGSGAFVEGLSYLNEAEVKVRSARLTGQLISLLTLSVDMRLEVGDWAGAAKALAEVTDLTARTNSTVLGAVMISAAKEAALRGQTALALERAIEAEHNTKVRRGSPTLAIAQIARGIAYLTEGRHSDAYSALVRIFDPKDPSHHYREQFGAIMYLAEAAVRCGQSEDVRPIIARFEPIARSSQSPLLTFQLQYANAVLASDEVAEHLYLACLSSGLTEWPWMRARVQLAYGRWLRRQRRVSQARSPLKAAHSTFAEIGATRWAAESLDELEAAGQPGDDIRSDNLASVLSVQELKIARLASLGLSNNEIGQQLYLSPRTVGSHLYRIFPKLGISTRSQLASHFAERVS